jgi:uncharacterized membrane protein
MLIFLGLVGLVVAIVALVKGSLPALGIKTRKVGTVVLIISLFVFIAGFSVTGEDTVSENTNIEKSQDAEVKISYKEHPDSVEENEAQKRFEEKNEDE